VLRVIVGDPIAPGAAALAEAKAYLRAGHGGEDALIERLLGSAVELCERFTGQVLLARGFVETVPASARWLRLGQRPVQAITGVDAVVKGSAGALVEAAYSIDIDAGGCGWVRVLDAGQGRSLRVHYTAGLAADWGELPEPLAQGVLRLTGHLYAERSGGDTAPPAAVTALWRPYRLLRVA
jgi:uncharacterized phiE125 gp8 family phage protein